MTHAKEKLGSKTTLMKQVHRFTMHSVTYTYINIITPQAHVFLASKHDTVPQYADEHTSLTRGVT